MYILGKRLQNAIPGNILHSGGDLLDEPLVTAQVVTEEVLDAEQLSRAGAPRTSLSLELLAHGVVDFERLAAVVDAVKVPEPRGRDEAQTAEGAGHPDLLGNRGHDELGDFAGGIDADAGELVHEGWVGEALHERVAVLVDVDAGNLGEKWFHFFLHHLPHEVAEEWVLHDFVDVFEAGQLAWVAYG